METIPRPSMTKKETIQELRDDLKLLLEGGERALVIDLEEKDQSSLPPDKVADIMIDARKNAGAVAQYLEGDYKFYKIEETDRTLFYIQLDR